MDQQLVIKNFAPKIFANEISTLLCGGYFAWFFNPFVAYENTQETGFQFTHTFMRDGIETSNALSLIKPLIYLIELKTGEKIKCINRIKANLRVPSSIPDSMDELHQDIDKKNFKSLLYYVNDSDGDTQFYANDKKTLTKSIAPESNTAVWFDSNLWHKSSPPNTSQNRIVINFIVEIEEQS
jgi:hypothetical protein